MRVKEFHEVMGALGVANHWIFETYGVPRFDDQMEKHFDEYCEVLKNLKSYDYIFLPHPVDGHHEHRFITNKLFKKIVKKVGFNPEIKVVFYEVWADIKKPNTFFDMTDGGFLYSKKCQRESQPSNTKFPLGEKESLLDVKIKINKTFYKSQWDYDKLEAVPTIKRSLADNTERYRVMSIKRYLRYVTFSFNYGIVGI